MSEEGIQTHHISYDPEITEIILKDEHIKIHGHGTGRVKGYKKVSSKPLIRNHLGLRIGFVGARVRDNLINLMDEIVNRKDLYSNKSDFIRSSIREKIRRDYPELMRALFEDEKEIEMIQ